MFLVCWSVLSLAGPPPSGPEDFILLHFESQLFPGTHSQLSCWSPVWLVSGGLATVQDWDGPCSGAAHYLVVSHGYFQTPTSAPGWDTQDRTPSRPELTGQTARQEWQVPFVGPGDL
jgi:hypothetical protein